jgi:hypothetical protein
VGTEPMRERSCVCPGEKPDGILDLVMKFREREVIDALRPVSDGEERVVAMSGRMMDGRGFTAFDCVMIEVHGKGGEAVQAASREPRAALRSILPNPFNPVTRIAYFLADDAYVTLSVYDVTGRLVDRLVQRMDTAGEHVAEWNASSASSGVYFCRFEAAGVVETRKLMLMK